MAVDDPKPRVDAADQLAWREETTERLIRIEEGLFELVNLMSHLAPPPERGEA